MANRTIKFYGKGYGTEPATVTVTLDGATVFNGAVTTVQPQFIDRSVDGQVELFTVQVPDDFTGVKPMTCTVNSGTVFFLNILGNYGSIPNPVFTPSEYAFIISGDTPSNEAFDLVVSKANPAFTAEEITFLKSTDPNDLSAQHALYASHGVLTNINGGADHWSAITTGEARTDITIDGVEQPIIRPPYGEYGWEIEAGQVLAYNLNIVAGPTN